MPIWLRRLTYNHLMEFVTAQRAVTNPSTDLDLNNLEQAKRLMSDNATYTTKASKT